MITDVFLDQKRVNVCELTTKTAPRESLGVQNRNGEVWRGWIRVG